MVTFYRRRTVDPEARSTRDLDDLRESLRKAYPVAPVVEGVDAKFIQLLERMADLDLDGPRKG